MGTKLNRISPLRRRVFFTFCMLVFVACGCVTHIQQLREAQTQFNMAATAENRARLGDPGEALLSTGEATTSYRMAVKIVSELLEKNKSNLAKDRLLGTAYTIKAMAEWRLGDYGSAMKTVSDALGNSKAKVFERDRILLLAIRGLVKNDQAFHHMMKKDYPYADLKRLLRDSLANLNTALSQAPRGSKIRLYILLSELAALKNWADLRGNPRAYAVLTPEHFDKAREIDEWCTIASVVWGNFEKEAGKLELTGAALLRDWGRRIAMPDTCK